MVTWLPTLLESKQENYFQPVLCKTSQTSAQKQNHVKIDEQNATIIDKRESFIPSHPSAITPKLSEDKHELLNKNFEQKYQFLSSNIVETNGHVLGLYKKVRTLENTSLQMLRADLEFLSQQMDEILKENNNSEKSSDQLNTQTDIVYLYHKLEKLTEKVVALETKLNTRVETQGCIIPVLQSNGIQVPEHTILSSNHSSPLHHQQTLQSNLLRFMLPSVVTVTAIVINMYLYLSPTKKFPF